MAGAAGVHRGGLSSDSGSGVRRSLNRCCTWPCAVGACHNSGVAARTDRCWQAVVQAGGRRDEQGKAWRQPGPPGAVRSRGDQAGSAALPTLDSALLLSPRPPQR